MGPKGNNDGHCLRTAKDYPRSVIELLRVEEKKICKEFVTS
jgi:hypothetical protein